MRLAESIVSSTPARSRVRRYTGAPATIVAVMREPMNAPIKRVDSPVTLRIVNLMKFSSDVPQPEKASNAYR